MGTASQADVRSDNSQTQLPAPCTVCCGACLPSATHQADKPSSTLPSATHQADKPGSTLPSATHQAGRQTQVHQPHLSSANTPHLDVSVDDALAVQVLERLEHVLHDGGNHRLLQALQGGSSIPKSRPARAGEETDETRQCASVPGAFRGSGKQHWDGQRVSTSSQHTGAPATVRWHQPQQQQQQLLLQRTSGYAKRMMLRMDPPWT